MDTDDELIILDLNGTLLRTDYDGKLFKDMSCDFVVGKKRVYVRPFVHTFLDTLFARYRVAVWTCARASQAKRICQLVFQHRYKALEFVWSQDECEHIRDDSRPNGVRYEKNIERVTGFARDRVLLVDDSPRKSGKYVHQCIHVKTYNPATPGLDTELECVCSKIERHLHRVQV